MGCTQCQDNEKSKIQIPSEAGRKGSCHHEDGEFTPSVIEINNPAEVVMLRKVVIGSWAGDDITIPPENGLYKNVILYYEANKHIYIYSSDGIPTRIEAEAGEFDTLSGRPKYGPNQMTSGTVIPIVQDATLTITKNSEEVGTFSSNQSTDATVDIVVPTKISDLDNDSEFVQDPDYVHTDNNYTDEEKSKLAGLTPGADVNVQSDWDEEDVNSDAYIKNKPTIPTLLSELVNDNYTVTDQHYNHTDNNYTDEDKAATERALQPFDVTHETWTFTLEDGTTVEKNVTLWLGE